MNLLIHYILYGMFNIYHLCNILIYNFLQHSPCLAFNMKNHKPDYEIFSKNCIHSKVQLHYHKLTHILNIIEMHLITYLFSTYCSSSHLRASKPIVKFNWTLCSFSFKIWYTSSQTHFVLFHFIWSLSNSNVDERLTNCSPLNYFICAWIIEKLCCIQFQFIYFCVMHV